MRRSAPAYRRVTAVESWKHCPRAEGFVTVNTNRFHGLQTGGEIFARIKFSGVLCQKTPNRSCGGEAQVSVDVDLPTPCLIPSTTCSTGTP